MDVRETVGATLLEIFAEEGIAAPSLDGDLVLLEAGLDSLGLAVLVTRLDERLGYDPFSLMTEALYPRTLAEFVEVYERYAPAS